MRARILFGLLITAWLGCWAAPAAAHPLAPALLELEETAPGRYAVLWRLSTLQPTDARPEPVLPAHCSSTGPTEAGLAGERALEARWAVDCGSRGLAGQKLGVTGLGRSGINAILRVRDRQGEVVQGLVDAAQPNFTVPERMQAEPVFQRYLVLGGEHLIFGPDHLLFLLALILLVRNPGRLVLTLTAFTLGHSLTLAAATLELIRVNPALMELGIALSLVVVARELLAARPSPLGRNPGGMAFAFGLLHGLGFAGALADVGLPSAEIPLALLAFNLGIELAQLALALACAWPLWWLHSQSKFGGRAVLPAYVIGALAALWCIERLGMLYVPAVS